MTVPAQRKRRLGKEPRRLCAADARRLVAERTMGTAPIAKGRQLAAGVVRTVNISIGGKSSAINIASQTDSGNLVGMLQSR